MGKVLCFNYETMADFEMVLPCHMLGHIGKEVVSISYGTEGVEGLSQLTYMPKMTVKDALTLDDVDGLIIPGGIDRECRSELIELIQNLSAKKKFVAAICAGPEFLAKAGLLDGHMYTTTLNESYCKEKKIVDFFPHHNYIEKNVVVDRFVITAKGHAYLEFGLAILDFFKVFDNEEERREYSASYGG